MRLRIASRTACTIAALTLALAVAPAALGQPAGDEYLPAVPKADGKKKSSSKGGGDSDSSSAAAAPASDDEGGPPSGSAGKGAEKNGETVANADAAPATPLDQASSDDDSDGALGTLLDPVVLLLIAGVAVTAIGMTMRRRQAVAGDPGSEGEAREPGSTPPTPDGEIIGREPPS